MTRAVSESGMQSDDGRVGHQAAAASWSLAEQSMLADSDDGSAAAGGQWGQLSVVVVVGVAVVLATVVVAVSALILHTQRRLHADETAPPRPDNRHAPASQRHSDVEQVLSVCHARAPLSGLDLMLGSLRFNRDWKNRGPGYKFPPKVQPGSSFGAFIFYLR